MPKLLSSKRIYVLMFITAWIGLLLSGYLAYAYQVPGELHCAIGGCLEVRNSQYSSIFGIDVPYFGILYYLGICLYSLSIYLPRKFYSCESLLLVVYHTLGFMFAMYLTYLEIFVIKALCQWCVFSAIAATLGLAWALLLVLFKEKENKR